MDEQQKDIRFENQKIDDIAMESEVKQSFIEYAMSVIISRALPDVRDGMKPGQRRIIYAMYEDHLTHDKPFRKSATTVGNVLGRYHPHGDAAVYGTMVRMAQDFSYRYPLIEGHGNFGSVDGDSAAAYRYTEARLDRISDEMTRDLEKEVVDFVPNFDNRLREPTVLPSRFPNLLVNGSMGIAVGMATNIPPHNLRETVAATDYRMDHPDCTVEELMQFLKGPDFPTAAIIYGTAGIKQAYRTGKGRVMVRSRAKVEEEKHRIIFTEIPYGVNKAMLCESIARLVREKRIDGITELRDESGRDGMSIVIEYRRDVNSQILLNQLYKYTELESTYAINMLAVVGNEPKILSLPEILDHYIAFQESVITRRTKFDLDRALARAHIFEGYKIALDNIDEIVQIMKTSPSIPESKATLCARFGLTDIQAQAIVDMTLGKLTGLERHKIEEELARLEALIADLRAILADEGRIKQIIKDEMQEIADRYGDDRRTEIVEAEDEIVLEDLIERHRCIITYTHAGYVKRQPADTYEAQGRGGKGIKSITTKEEDFIEKVISVNSHAYLLMFTNFGKVYMRKAYMIPEASRTAKGSNIVNILELSEGERVTSFIGINGFAGGDSEYLTMITKKGIVKRTLLSQFEYQRKGGKIAINLDEGDELLFTRLTKGDASLLIATRNGMAVRFDEKNIRAMGRAARGVKGIRLDEGDYITGITTVDEDKWLLTVTENGYGKLSPFSDFREMKNRGGRGVTCQNTEGKYGRLAGIAAVSDEDDIMLTTNLGQLIRIPADSVRKCSRSAGGVIVMRLAEDQSIVNVTRISAESEEAQGEEDEIPQKNPGDGVKDTSAADLLSDTEADTEE